MSSLLRLTRLPSVVLLAFAAACADTPTASTPSDAALSRSAAADAARAAKPGSATIVELASATPFLSTLVTAVLTSDAQCGTQFAALLSSPDRQVTVFAPTDAAFATLIGQLGAGTVLSCAVLPTVLAYHVTPGRHTSTSVLARRSIRMLSGESASVVGTTIAGAPLNLGFINLSARNGVVHVVDAVLIPPSIAGSGE